MMFSIPGLPLSLRALKGQGGFYEPTKEIRAASHRQFPKVFPGTEVPETITEESSTAMSFTPLPFHSTHNGHDR
jgi:hypothetical protein